MEWDPSARPAAQEVEQVEGIQRRSRGRAEPGDRNDKGRLRSHQRPQKKASARGARSRQAMLRRRRSPAREPR